PAIVSGWLLSTNSVTTKIAFGICSISLSRLIEHFNDDEPEKINTIISRYFNQYKKHKKPAEKIKELGEEIMKRNGKIAYLTEKIGKKNKKAEQIKDKTMKIQKQTEVIKKQTE